MDKILKNLNPKQIEAVKTIDGPVLIVAGPGSGKTATLSHRIAYMIKSGIKPENILAVTFTNKAAQEMKERVLSILEKDNLYSWDKPTIGTFHSICAKILRKEARYLDFRRNFSIYDSDDQLNLIKQIVEKVNLKINNLNLYIVLSKISKLKSELIEPDDFFPKAKGFYEENIAIIYEAYQKELKKSNAMDFDDLIAMTVKLFKKYPEILNKYQEKFKYILIDEYQDTDIAQYELTKILSSKYKNIFVIGDTDQSIYKFRFADFRNMLNFERDFPEAKIVMLEQNYRSTKTILAAGQGIIQNNQYRHPKNLWTSNKEGDKILIKQVDDEREEAEFLIKKMEELARQGYKLKDFVILYRTHAQSRPIEEEFLKRGFPYKIIGSLRFYERKEIKDILAYLKLLANPNDLVSLQRIYNVPSRGIGKSSFVRILDYSFKNKVNLPKTLLEAKKIENLSPKSRLAIYSFGKFIEGLNKKIETMSLPKLIKFITKEIKYEEYLDTKKEEGYARWENIKELITVAKKYNSMPAKKSLPKFLENVALVQETDHIEDNKDLIHMMTFHSAKGLEFPVVFMVGMEEGLLPHSKSIDNPVELEEERRLCYVGITRAKEKVFLTTARFRNIFGTSSYGLPSRFLSEIPEDVVKIEEKEETIFI